MKTQTQQSNRRTVSFILWLIFGLPGLCGISSNLFSGDLLGLVASGILLAIPVIYSLRSPPSAPAQGVVVPVTGQGVASLSTREESAGRWPCADGSSPPLNSLS